MTRATYPRTDAVIDTGWRDRAACLGMDYRLFDAGPNGTTVLPEARAACSACEVTAECLADAMRTEHQGYRADVRAGLTPTGRDLLHKETR